MRIAIITKIVCLLIFQIEESLSMRFPMKKISSVLVSISILTNSAPCFAADTAVDTRITAGGVLSDADVQTVQVAFRDFDMKRLDDADKEFTISIQKWKDLQRPRDEVVSLLKARGNVRLDNKQFNAAIQDYNEALELMKSDGEKDDGTGRYPEYPDTFVGRGQAKEGLADWKGALQDYDKAINLWGGGRGEGVNPYVLNYRGNVLCKLNRYADAVLDYSAASDRFNLMRDVKRFSDSRANLALALYETGKTDHSVKEMKNVIRKNPGYGDMHVALAADAWSNGNYIVALKEWQFVCDDIDVGCKAYEDPQWVSVIRRWPPSLSSKLTQFLNREVPDKLKGLPGDALAPSFSTLK